MKAKECFWLTVAIAIALSSAGLAATVYGQEKQQIPVSDSEYQIGAILFHQKAAEYRALTYQAFNLARMRLDMDKKLRKKLPKRERKKPRAIVVDADETVLDNSPYFAELIKTQQTFNITSFFDWKKSLKAKAVPGSVEFLNYAKSKKIDVFYVSNVPNSFKEVTIKGLKKAGFPDADDEHVMLITDSSSKEPRRQKIREKYRIMMLIGDNLNDLSIAFERKPTAERFNQVDKAKGDWGGRFIVVPNIMYGAWESAIYGRGRPSEAEKRVKRIEALEGLN